MDAVTLADAYKAAGFKVFTTTSTSWLLGEHGAAVNVSPLQDVFPSPPEVEQVLSTEARLVRFPTRAALAPNCVEFILSAGSYGLDVLAQRARNQTRRGLERCRVREAHPHEIVSRGLEINHLVLARQRRASKLLLVPDRWKRYVETFLAMPDVKAFVACVDRDIAAYVMTCIVDNKIALVHPFLDRHFQNAYPMNALIYSAINHVRAEVGPLPVSYGFGSFWGNEPLDHFKTGMGFETVPRLRITIFSPVTSVLLRPMVVTLAEMLPTLGGKVGPKLRRLAEERQLGLNWMVMMNRPRNRAATDG